jgi:hypothetical protein
MDKGGIKMKKIINKIIKRGTVDVSASEAKEKISNIYNYILDMYYCFVADENNTATDEEIEEWKKNGYIELYPTQNGIQYLAWTTEQEKANQNAWGFDSWQDIVDNDCIENYLF